MRGRRHAAAPRRVPDAAEAVAAEHEQQSGQQNQGRDNQGRAHRLGADVGRRENHDWLFIGGRGSGAGNAGADFVELHAAAEKRVFVRRAIGRTSLICHDAIIPQRPGKTIRAGGKKQLPGAGGKSRK